MTEVGVDIIKASKVLMQGGLVGIPTETVYGLAANALDDEAVVRIFEAKRRPSFDPLIVHLSESDTIDKYVSDVPSTAIKLMEAFWPGPLTVVLPKKKIIPDLVTSGMDTVGIRKPKHPLTQALLASLSFPLAAPSANIFGRVSPTEPSHVVDQLGDSIEYVLDGGSCAVGLESTIIGWPSKSPVIYRLGGISIEDIEAIVGPVTYDREVSTHPVAPGMLTSHYAPSKPLSLGKSPSPGASAGLLRFKSNHPDFPTTDQVILSPSGDLHEAARNLFSCLRKLDDLFVDSLFAERVPDIGLGRAINDRLERAAAK